MKLSMPKSPFERVKVAGESISIDIVGKVLVVPTGNSSILPALNEYTLSNSRLTIAESPFGGLKGSGSPDYMPGTLFCQTDGVYLTDTSGTNSTKTLTAGKLSELGKLTVNTTDHKITEEFRIRNDNTGSDVTVIDACDSTTGWSATYGTGTISVENGRLKFTGNADESGRVLLEKNISVNISSKSFLCVSLQSSLVGYPRTSIYSDGGYINLKSWDGSRFEISANQNANFVYPINAPLGVTGMLPSNVNGTLNLANVTLIRVGVTNLLANASVTFYLNNITACNGTWAKVEVAVPDMYCNKTSNSNDIGFRTYVWNGSSYPTALAYDGVNMYWNSSNSKFLDGTTFSSMYGLANSWTQSAFNYNIGIYGSTKTTKTGGLFITGYPAIITYSSNYGTAKRIGFAILMPPSDGNRTLINQVQLKLEFFYDDVNGNTVKDLSGCGNNGTITGGVTKLAAGGLQFDGSTGYVKVGNGNSIDVSNNVYICLEFTPNVTLTGSGAKYILSKYGSIEVGYGITAGSIKVLGLEYTTTFTAGTKYKLEGVYNGTATEIKINNVSVAIGNVTLSNTSNDLRIGGGELSPGTWRYSNIIIHDAIITSGTYSTHYQPTISNMGSTTYEFTDSTNASYGLQNVIKPWIALYDPATTLIDFYLFTERPKNLSFKRDETGQIYQLVLYPGNGLLYHGQITHFNPALDSDSDLIPDCLDYKRNGSLYKFLEPYAFAIDYYSEYDLSTSAITANDFGITANSLDIIPFVVAEGDMVSTTANVVLPAVETVTTATGNLSIVDVRGQSAVRVRDIPYTNSGECKVFDTVTAGNTNESTWVRVYRTDWVFTGDCVIDNGLYKSIIAAGGNIKSYVFNGTSYVNASDKDSTYLTISVSGTSANTATFTISSISSSKIVINVTATYTGNGNTGTYTVTLLRGVSAIQVGSGALAYYSTGGSGSIICTKIDCINEDTSNVYTPLTNHYHVVSGVDKSGHTAIPFVLDCNGGYWISTQYGYGSSATPAIFGAIPFDCTLLYKTASDMDGGETI